MDQQKENSRTAYHEAGHLVMAFLEGYRMTGYTVQPRAGRPVQVRVKITRSEAQLAHAPEEQAMMRARVQLGGPVAEELLYGEVILQGTDHETACTWIAPFCEGNVVSEDTINRLQEEVRGMVMFQWPLVESIAASLSDLRSQLWAGVRRSGVELQGDDEMLTTARDLLMRQHIQFKWQ